MNKEQKLVLELIKSTLIGTKVEIGDDYDWHSFLQLCIDGGVCSIIFDAIRELDGFSEEIFNDLKKQAFLNLSYSVKQEHEYQVISAAFENNNIDYLPLKGLVLREYYPKKYYRMMCDMDILINPKQYDITYKTMKEIGYSLEEESDHNIAWSNNGVTVELHKKLYPNFDERFNEYFKSGWQFARCCNGHQYRMSDEDFYISIFVHFVRHFRSGGIGIRQFLDLWVYRKNNPFLDDDYIIRI